MKLRLDSRASVSLMPFVLRVSTKAEEAAVVAEEAAEPEEAAAARCDEKLEGRTRLAGGRDAAVASAAGHPRPLVPKAATVELPPPCVTFGRLRPRMAGRNFEKLPGSLRFGGARSIGGSSDVRSIASDVRSIVAVFIELGRWRERDRIPGQDSDARFLASI